MKLDDIKEEMERERKKMNAGKEQARWECMINMIRFAIKREIILDVEEKVRTMYEPYYFGCRDFKASNDFLDAIPHPRITAEDYKNLQYSAEKITTLYHPDAYTWGIKFIQLAHIVYLLVADVSSSKLAVMFDVEEAYIQEIQQRLAEQVPDTYDYETFVNLFWEEKLYASYYQCGMKIGKLHSIREFAENVLQWKCGILEEFANMIEIPVDILEQVMKSMGMEERDAPPLMVGTRESCTEWKKR